jgi:hypothetical protein
MILEFSKAGKFFSVIKYVCLKRDKKLNRVVQTLIKLSTGLHKRQLNLSLK